ncbi:hypothetical protein LGH83_19160 [Lichenihabitans sp. PAMC28606]|uniref:hypothetical protein n=1 Tax=Lichenihabitans sp. PAMC28606 TaxID=2880932 RepID=UPI001D0B2ECD|nr:hypothetical protein [Lichenihabitans sp. PAMC28606]UDL94586.1 hypothetical protein LGH83_19160 [Lichenihabitans sp. PAMC28606]
MRQDDQSTIRWLERGAWAVAVIMMLAGLSDAARAADAAGLEAAYKSCAFYAAMRFPTPATEAHEIAKASVASCEKHAQAMRTAWAGSGPDIREREIARAREEALAIALKAADAMHRSRRGM